MSNLPTLPTLHIRELMITDDSRVYVLLSGPVPGSVAYVPASALDAANEALRQERAEVERLRDIIQHVVAGMGHSGSEAPESLPCNESCIGCDDDTIEGDGHRRDLPADRCTDHPDAESDSECWRCLLRATLTPRPGAKESP